MTEQGRPTHFISQSKFFCLWHQRLVYMSNARVVRASKLTDGINLDNKNKEYNPVKIFIDSNKSNVSDEKTPKHIVLVCQTRVKNVDTLDKLYQPCIESKVTGVVRHNKSMIVIKDKLEEVHTNLYGLHNLLLQLRSTYIATLMCEHTTKTWPLYLHRKDNFVDVFQT